MSLGLQDAGYVVHRSADQCRPILLDLRRAVGMARLFFCHKISVPLILRRLQRSSFEPCFEIATPSNAAITIGPAPRLFTIDPNRKPNAPAINPAPTGYLPIPWPARISPSSPSTF